MPNNHNAESQMVPTPEPRSVEVFNADDPRSVINLVPPSVSTAIRAALESHPDLFGLDEQRFKEELREKSRFVSATDNRIRLRFWDEYDRCQAEVGKEIVISRVFAGVCTRDYFYKSYVTDPYRMAWLLCPPANYQTIAEEALAFGLEQMRSILAMDDKEVKNGASVLNMNLLKLKVKIVEMLDQRLKGGVVQKSIQLQVGASAGQVAQAGAAHTMEEMDRQMEDLRRRSARADHSPTVKDVSAEVMPS